jgi:hypothetical protein
MKYTGRCACGKVRVGISGEAVAVRQCWCRQCQYVSGGGAANNAMFHTGDVHFEGALGSRSYMADSGNTLTQWFCTECATPVYAQSSARPHLRTMRLVDHAQPHDLAPRVAIWTSMAPPWACIDPKLERYEEQAPPPPASA